MSLCGSRYGRGRSSTAFTMLNIALFAPIPKASVSTATTVNPGLFFNLRSANRKFCARRKHHRPPDFGSREFKAIQIKQYSERSGRPRQRGGSSRHSGGQCTARAALSSSGVILCTLSQMFAIFSSSSTERPETERSFWANSISTECSRRVETESSVWK